MVKMREGGRKKNEVRYIDGQVPADTFPPNTPHRTWQQLPSR